MFKFIKTFTVAALFLITASTSVAMANDLNPDPQGVVIELNAEPTHETTEQNTSTETNTTSSDNMAQDVMEDLRALNEMARQSSRPGAGW